MSRRRGAHRAAGHADERWLLTYADMITLLMALFIVMFSISSVNRAKFDQLAASMKRSLAGSVLADGPSLGTGGSVGPTPAAFVVPGEPATLAYAERGAVASRALDAARRDAAREDAALRRAKDSVDHRLAALGLGAQVETRVDDHGLVIRLVTDDVLFAVGSPTVAPEGERLLRIVAAAIDPLPLPIHVEGHTDGRPYPGDAQGNLRLSMQRGMNVALFLLGNGVDPATHRGDLMGTGYGDARPLPGLSRLDPRQRRVEVIVVRRDYVGEAERAAAGPLGPAPLGESPLGSSPLGDVGADPLASTADHAHG